MKRSLVLLAAMGLLVSACGSGDEQSSPGAPVDTETTAPVAGAQENAVTAGAVCYSWPNGTTDPQPCAVGSKGPGGGRVFYDAGSVQPWGRFLEVAPQNWGPTLVACKSCGAATEAPYNVSKQTSDGVNDMTGYYLCRSESNGGASRVLLPGEAADTAWAIGAGRRNTEVLLQAAGCVDGSTSAVTLAAAYAGGGLSDWYLPSGGELTELCKYEGRNAIGGFVGPTKHYQSSTVGPGGNYTVFYGVNFGGKPPTCSREEMIYTSDKNNSGFVRPIRAFA